MNINLSTTAKRVLEARYLTKKGSKIVETPEQMFKRVAKNISEAETLYKGSSENAFNSFYDLMTSLDFLPNSPTLMNAGTPLQQLSACFVLPVEDSMGSIFTTLKNTALIHKSGGGTGFSFSRIRPKNDFVHTTSGVASGPISFIKVFDAATEVIKQGGKRRGANMGILRIDHPDILDFITAKDKEGELANFNISISVTNKFITALKNNTTYELINPRDKKIVGKLKAQEVFDKIAYQAWKNGEPGFVFIDVINKYNPTPNIGKIESTNPCGEQPLLPYESCNLGSINLSNMVENDSINWDRLEKTTKNAVWFLDNVIDMNKFPVPEIGEMTRGNRKIGLGIMGWADMLIKLKIKYNSNEALKLAEKVMKFIQTKGREKSIELASERGTFPNWKGSIWDKKGIKIRNATITTIAPTGSISIIAGASSGIEPLFALGYLRKISIGEFQEIHPLFEQFAKERKFYSKELMTEVINKGSIKDIKAIPDDIRELFITTMDISPEWHIKIQAAFQKYTDNAVSKTINLPSDATVDDIKKAYLLSYKLGCKGITVYRDRSREVQVLSTKDNDEKIVKRQSLIPRKRPTYTRGITIRVQTGCGNMYVTINEDEYGLCEVFAQLGKTGGCPASQTEAIARLVSLSLRSGINVKSVIKELRGIRCPNPFRTKDGMVLSCPDAIGIALDTYLNEAKDSNSKNVENLKVTKLKINNVDIDQFLNGAAEMKNNKKIANIDNKAPLICPECGSTMFVAEGCNICPVCGYSKCE